MGHKDFFEELLDVHGMSEAEWSQAYDTEHRGYVPGRAEEIRRIMSAKAVDGKIVFENYAGQTELNI